MMLSGREHRMPQSTPFGEMTCLFWLSGREKLRRKNNLVYCDFYTCSHPDLFFTHEHVT